MPEILEKGLIVGFGLSVAIVFFTICSPYFFIMFDGGEISLNEHDSFVLIMEYGISHIPSHYGETSTINMSLSIKISLSLVDIDELYELHIISSIKYSLFLDIS